MSTGCPSAIQSSVTDRQRLHVAVQHSPVHGHVVAGLAHCLGRTDLGNAFFTGAITRYGSQGLWTGWTSRSDTFEPLRPADRSLSDGASRCATCTARSRACRDQVAIASVSCSAPGDTETGSRSRTTVWTSSSTIPAPSMSTRAFAVAGSGCRTDELLRTGHRRLARRRAIGPIDTVGRVDSRHRGRDHSTCDSVRAHEGRGDARPMTRQSTNPLVLDAAAAGGLEGEDAVATAESPTGAESVGDEHCDGSSSCSRA